MLKVLVIGATSAIAEATARIYASRGARLHLVGRNESKLQAIADDLRVRGAANVTQSVVDLDRVDAHAALVDEAATALDGIDVALIAHGVLPSQAECEANAANLLAQFQTNAISPISLLAVLAKHPSLKPGATLAVISSVAGDRGRASNYAYGSAKAAVSEFAAGLRQSLNSRGVNVLTIKPGFVDTPMTRDFKKGALWAQPADVANGIVRAIEKRRGVAYLPWFWWGIMTIIKHIPEIVFRRLKL